MNGLLIIGVAAALLVIFALRRTLIVVPQQSAGGDRKRKEISGRDAIKQFRHEARERESRSDSEHHSDQRRFQTVT